MGVDYSASLAYGYVAPDIDREKFPDGWYEIEGCYWDALAESLGLDPKMPWQERREWLTEHPCPISYVSIGSAYSDNSTSIILSTSEYAHSADIGYGPAGMIELESPDPQKVKNAVNGFLELLGIEPFEEDPKWYFGWYVS